MTLHATPPPPAAGTDETAPDDGLFRTRLAGAGASTSAAFHAVRTWAGLGTPEQAGNTALYGRRLAVSPGSDEGFWEVVGLQDGVFLNLSDCHYSHRRTERVRPEGFVEFHFMLAGNTRLDASWGEQVRIAPPNVTIVEQGASDGYEVSCGPGPWRSVGMHVPREYFRRFVELSEGTQSPLLRGLDAWGESGSRCLQIPMGIDALRPVEQMLANPYQGYRRLLFAQAKGHEVLCAVLDLWSRHLSGGDARDGLSSRDLALVEQARDLILANLSQAATIAELSRAVGTNVSKLKRGFKLLYGTTVFEYGHRCRMNHAMFLLAQERMQVGEVALAVGYVHQTSFTASFREFFGVTPKDARRIVLPRVEAPPGR